jgi:hypothetical protein
MRLATDSGRCARSIRTKLFGPYPADRDGSCTVDNHGKRVYRLAVEHHVELGVGVSSFSSNQQKFGTGSHSAGSPIHLDKIRGNIACFFIVERCESRTGRFELGEEVGHDFWQG